MYISAGQVQQLQRRAPEAGFTESHSKSATDDFQCDPVIYRFSWIRKKEMFPEEKGIPRISSGSAPYAGERVLPNSKQHPPQFRIPSIVTPNSPPS